MSLTFDRGGITTLNEPANDNFKIFDRGGLYTYVASAGGTTAILDQANSNASGNDLTIISGVNEILDQSNANADANDLTVSIGQVIPLDQSNANADANDLSVIIPSTILLGQSNSNASGNDISVVIGQVVILNQANADADANDLTTIIPSTTLLVVASSNAEANNLSVVIGTTILLDQGNSNAEGNDLSIIFTGTEVLDIGNANAEGNDLTILTGSTTLLDIATSNAEAIDIIVKIGETAILDIANSNAEVIDLIVKTGVNQILDVGESNANANDLIVKIGATTILDIGNGNADANDLTVDIALFVSLDVADASAEGNDVAPIFSSDNILNIASSTAIGNNLKIVIGSVVISRPSKYALYRKRMQSTKTDSQFVDCQISEDIKSNFTNQPNYRQVNRNFDYVTTYDILFANGNVADKSVGYKQLISYPYDEYKFSKGDYIHINYGGELTTWLLTTLETVALYDVRGRLEQCNNDLKWIDLDGNTRTYPCIIMDEIKEDRIRSNKFITMPDGYITVYVQDNVYTRDLKINKRFIFNGTAYEIRSIINYSDTGLIRYIMVKDTENEETDDLINNIADVNELTYSLSIVQDDFEQTVGYTDTLDYNLSLNGEVSTKDIEWVSSDEAIATINSSTGEINLLSLGSVTFTARMTDNTSISDSITVTVVGSLSSISENIISPDIINIFQDETQTYSVYNYVDNVQSADTFTIVASGASSDKYTLTIIDGNNFSVKSLGYSSDKLTITCTNDSDASEVVKIISLKGLW